MGTRKSSAESVRILTLVRCCNIMISRALALKSVPFISGLVFVQQGPLRTSANALFTM